MPPLFSLSFTGAQRMRASKEWNLRSGRRLECFQVIRRRMVTWGNVRQQKPQQPQQPQQLHGLNSHQLETTSSTLWSRFFFIFDFRSTQYLSDAHLHRSQRSSWYLWPERQGYFNTDLSMTISNCFSANDNKPEGQSQICSPKLCWIQIQQAFGTTGDSASARNSTHRVDTSHKSTILLQADSEHTKKQQSTKCRGATCSL